ncbi:unnamed protein product [Bursaphelenchus okinawaensis]|uniref:Sidoreflexin n=1 Tax=Bursaphelenchus okinawaensis TaxID=465554 RepID=A0A811K588_9BILA|nr:unnamed protein product [Bursaphelenchus okinawaensis]CAG9090983.1 unnamed protein product [Bursaphelenchus okinawaensis]
MDQRIRLFHYPEFSLEKPRYPTDSFLGRYLNYVDLIDPRTLFASNAKLEDAKKLLEDYKQGKSPDVSDKELWQASKLVSSTFHPDTGEKILPPFRMSGYVPFGWVTVTGMLLPNPSWGSILFWQWANQSHNACVNYANRNASNPQPLSVYGKAYLSAVGAAMSISAGLTYVIKSLKSITPTQRLIIQRFVPLPATSLASTLNVLCMRMPEINKGIDVLDSEGKVVGVSREAAKKAVKETAMTRAFLPVPLLLIPPCIMPFIEKYKFVQNSATRHLLVNAIVCTLSFGFSLPIALALFPQTSTIQREQLEDHIQSATKQQILYFNKGL